MGPNPIQFDFPEDPSGYVLLSHYRNRRESFCQSWLECHLLYS